MSLLAAPPSKHLSLQRWPPLRVWALPTIPLGAAAPALGDPPGSRATGPGAHKLPPLWWLRCGVGCRAVLMGWHKCWPWGVWRRCWI